MILRAESGDRLLVRDRECSLIITNPQGRITFVSEPVTGNQHDMAKLKGSLAEKILKKAGGVFGDKGFIGTDYITTPIRKPQCRQLFRAAIGLYFLKESFG